MDARRDGTADGAGATDRPSVPPAVRAPSSLAECFWTAAMRVDLLGYLTATVVGGLFMSATLYVVPPLLLGVIVSFFFLRLTHGEPSRAVPAALFLLALAAAPVVAAQLLDALLRLAHHTVPHAGLLVGAVAGWIVLPLLAAPAHWLRGRGGLRDALARSLCASGERRLGVGALAFGVGGLVLGVLLVSGAAAVELVVEEAELPNLLLALVPHGDLDAWPLLLLGPIFVPIAVLAPLASAVLAEQDDWLLAGEVAPPAPPIHAAAPLWLAVALMLGALATTSAPPWRPYEGDRADVTRIGSTHWLGLDGSLLFWEPERREAPGLLRAALPSRPALRILGSRCFAVVLGPRGGHVLGASVATREVVLEAEDGALLAVPLDEGGCRLDDDVPARLAVRLASPLGVAAALVALLFLGGTLLLPRLRPGLLHRVLRPGRFELAGMIELDPGARVARTGRRVTISGAVFRSDDGEVVLRVDLRVLVLGMDAPAATVRATLLSPARPAFLSLRSGTAPFPADAVLLGLGEPRNAALGHELHRSAVLPVLALSALATLVCVLLAATL